MQADIRKAILTVEVHEKDCPFLRFLWPRSRQSNEVLIWRLAKLPFGFRMNFSPYLLTSVIQKHLEDLLTGAMPTEQEFLLAFMKSFCVANLLSRVCTPS